MYRIESITDYEGNLKTDRIGRIVDGIGALQGSIFCLYSDRPENKDCYGKALWTSQILSKEEVGDEVIIKTINSIYRFRRIDDN